MGWGQACAVAPNSNRPNCSAIAVARTRRAKGLAAGSRSRRHAAAKTLPMLADRAALARATHALIRSATLKEVMIPRGEGPKAFEGPTGLKAAPWPGTQTRGWCSPCAAAAAAVHHAYGAPADAAPPAEGAGPRTHSHAYTARAGGAVRLFPQPWLGQRGGCRMGEGTIALSQPYTPLLAR